MKSTIKTDEYGNKFWLVNDLLHNENGPACIESNGDKYWYRNGKRHREDGPAVEWANGDKYWYINDKFLHPIENQINIPQTEDEMLQVFNQYKFVKVGDEYYFINQYIKKYKKDWYEKYRLLFK